MATPSINPEHVEIDIATSCSSSNADKGRKFPYVTKARVRSRLDSNTVTAFMTIVTIYALYSDDVRVLAFNKPADIVFVILSSMAFFLFILEIVVQCWCREDYLTLPSSKGIKKAWETYTDRWRKKLKLILSSLEIGSFYFWLDLIATASMIFEIPYLFQASNGDVNNFDSARAGKASRAGAKAARVVKVVRMIRLVRLVKLYKYFSGNKHRHGVVVPDNREELLNMPPESHVGAEMSDRTTKKVIVGILVMLIVIPLLQVEELEYINELGMQMVFERWEKLAHLDPLIEYEGRSDADYESWKHAEEYFIQNNNCIQLRYTHDNKSTKTYATIPPGRVDPDGLRSLEKSALTIFGNSDSYSMAAEFDISPKADEEALLGILLTTFVILLLAIGTMTFARDVNNLVIIPIENMVQLVQEICENPLGKNLSLKSEDITNKMDEGMETTVLLRTISKIAGLMRVGFGEAGAEIIGKHLNMHSDGGAIILLTTGKKIQSIFAFCDVRNFTDTTECLQEEVMLFVNRIAHILHSIVVQCDGAANKNIGDAFLLTWKLDPAKLGSCKDHNYSGDKALYSLLKTMVEMIRHEEFICDFSPTAMGALYERMPGYKCRIGCGLHFGWAVEGAIGSDKKIDASYISPHVNWSEFLESSTKEYGVPLLMSEPFFKLLSPNATRYCRQVDNIKKGANDEVTGLYTYDANLDIDIPKIRHRMTVLVEPNLMERRKARKTLARSYASRSSRSLRRSQLIASHSRHSRVHRKTHARRSVIVGSAGAIGEAPEIFLPPFTPDVWDEDRDVVRLRMHFDDERRAEWSEGIRAYIKGDWSKAIVQLNKVLELSNGTDGPSKHLLRKMEECNFTVPRNWSGYRDLS